MAEDEEQDSGPPDGSSFTGPSIEYIAKARIDPPIITITPGVFDVTVGPEVGKPFKSSGS